MLSIHLSVGFSYLKKSQTATLTRERVLPKWMAIILALEDSYKGY